jgi:hypothetical protein
MYASMRFWKPQIALFQSVPVVVSLNSSMPDAANHEPSIRLADSFEAATVQATRFICRFHNSTEHSAITQSKFPFDYEFVTWRKKSKMLESDTGKKSLDQGPFWLSQLLFSCPIPPEFQVQVREGEHVVHDVAHLWVDIIPIRTPPRSDKFLLTRDQVGEDLYRQQAKSWFRLDVEYGKNHTLPLIEDSGRWANLIRRENPAGNNHYWKVSTLVTKLHHSNLTNHEHKGVYRRRNYTIWWPVRGLLRLINGGETL